MAPSASASASTSPPLAAFASLLTSRRFAAAKAMLPTLLTPRLLELPFADLCASSLPRAAPPHAVAAFHDMLFRAYSDAGAADRAAEALDLTASRLGRLDPRSLTSSLLSLRRAGQLAAAAGLLRRALATCPDAVSPLCASVAIDGFCKSGRVDDARRLLDEMPHHGVRPNALCYNALLDAYTRRKDERRVVELLETMENDGVEATVGTYTILVDGLSAARDITKVEAVFDEMKAKNVAGDVYFYTAVITAYCRTGNVRRASEVFDECVGNGIEPNEHTYGALINGFCKIGQMEAAEMLLADMQGRGVGYNQIIFNTVIDGYCRKGMVDGALKVKAAMEKTGIKLDVYTYNTLACGLCRVNRMDEAKTLLHVMIENGVTPNYVSYTTLISIHCKEGDMVEATRLFREMKGQGAAPSVVTYNVMIDGYIKKGSIREAERFRKEMEKKGLVADVYTYASLIHGHCVNGKVDVALKLFEEMKQRGKKPNVVVYTALISGLAKEGRSEEAFQLYDDMLKAGLTPDDSLYSALVGSLHTDKRRDNLSQTSRLPFSSWIADLIAFISYNQTKKMTLTPGDWTKRMMISEQKEHAPISAAPLQSRVPSSDPGVPVCKIFQLSAPGITLTFSLVRYIGTRLWSMDYGVDMKLREEGQNRTHILAGLDLCLDIGAPALHLLKQREPIHTCFSFWILSSNSPCDEVSSCNTTNHKDQHKSPRTPVAQKKPSSGYDHCSVNLSRAYVPDDLARWRLPEQEEETVAAAGWSSSRRPSGGLMGDGLAESGNWVPPRHRIDWFLPGAGRVEASVFLSPMEARL
ncbi:hypothetical protein U9M48_016177 [Paspalum notatum var. saurae]|uniref:Pentacotripeptide-repeat region of PRORP domain-containing protein n=1 Tax=Paspalum notatum var. saurae TaxID=547442 RepID=A0AAQ3T5M9_PASNO